MRAPRSRPEPHQEVRAHCHDQNRRCGFGHPEFFEPDPEGERDFRHGRIEAVALACHAECRGAEEIPILREVLVFARGLVTRPRPQLMKKIDAPIDHNILTRSGCFEGHGELRSLRFEQLPRLRTIDLGERPRGVRVAQVEPREDRRSGLERAPRLRTFFAGRLGPVFPEFVAQLHGAFDPVGRRRSRFGECCGARLRADADCTDYAFEPPRARERSPRAGHVSASPRAKRLEDASGYRSDRLPAQAASKGRTPRAPYLRRP